MKYEIRINGRPITITTKHEIAINIFNWYKNNKHLLNINKIELIAEK